uniref:Cytochrome c biogenesis protein CcsA n=1 Tax=Chondria tumulosa TaxID=2740715 RepID=A0A896SQF1_9FLOR|nr:heme attachment to plastid cytochrome c [Chondria tumulosa]QSD57066.1 heme attachment to plastid cytochrome c [Chondria tumulosa]
MDHNIIENYLINISFASLLIGLFISWLNLIVKNNKILIEIYNVLTIGVNINLGAFLSIRWIKNEYFPLSNLYESLIFLTWCLLFIESTLLKKTRNKLVSAILSPIVLLIISFTSLCLPEDIKVATPLVPALQSNWLIMHVSVMMLSYAILMTGSLLSTLFLIISSGKKIKIQGNSYNNSNKIILKYGSEKIDTNSSKRSEKINFLQGIDNLSYRTIGLGFPLLTIGIISGAVWANEAWGTYWSWDPKETWALITWIIFAIYLHSRINKQLQGYIPSVIGSIGFIVIWICYLGVNFLAKGLHSYGWIFS